MFGLLLLRFYHNKQLGELPRQFRVEGDSRQCWYTSTLQPGVGQPAQEAAADLTRYVATFPSVAHVLVVLDEQLCFSCPSTGGRQPWLWQSIDSSPAGL